jgi:hypothetical protein
MPTLRPLYALTFLLSLTSAIFAAPPIIEARQGFTTKLLREERVGEAAEEPPASSGLKLISYAAPLGQNAAYVSADPGDGKKHAAIIWLVGGFSNSISDIAWTPGPASNDQSASGFRDHGIVMMYPSLRGGNINPGHIETFYGEVDDVLAAAKHLASLDYVDPKRIYLGGHSTGGTLALLVASAAEDRFRAVFALGPVEDVVRYGAEVLPFDLENPKEGQLRAPQRWLKDIKCPTFIFEGTQRGNIQSLFALQARNKNPLIKFEPIQGETHFSIIAPLVKLFSTAIIADSATAKPFQLPPPAQKN